jgi:hypothetical protein
LPGDASAINRWDVGSVDGGANLRVRYSLIYSSPTAPTQTWADDGNNKILGIAAGPLPGFASGYNACANYPPLPSEQGCLMIQIQQLRTYFRFRPAAIISVDLPDNAFGDYHLLNVGSPAHAMGINPQDLVTDPLVDDIDANLRPIVGPVTAGAHEVTTPAPVTVVAPVVTPAAAANPPPANPPPAAARTFTPLGVPAGVLVPVIGAGAAAAPAAVRLAPISGAPRNSAGGASAPAVTAGSNPGLFAGILAFAALPEHQGESGLAALIALSLVLAAFQFGKVVLGRRRKTAPVNSDEQNIEGGEQQ